MDTGKNNPGVASVLSFVFTGLGQLYNGQIIKGLVLMFFAAVGMFFLIVSSIFIGYWLFGKIFFPRQLILSLLFFALGLVDVCVLGIYSIFDAYKLASKK